MWNKYFDFSDNAETKDWGLHHYQHSFLGWNQKHHKKWTAPFVDEFFKKIQDAFKNKGRFVAECYFYILRPMIATDEGIQKYEDLLANVQQVNPDNTQLITLIKETIGDLKEMQIGQEASRNYLK
jgi:hypothetical protein